MQQINLYIAEFRPNREPLRSLHMLYGALFFILVLGCYSLWSWQQIAAKNEEMIKQQSALQQAKLEVETLLQNNTQIKMAEVDQQLINYQQELARRLQIYSLIANKDLGNNTGFSEYLRGLGRQSLTTLSLSVFSLQKGGRYLELMGVARSADQVPFYIERLRQEAIFQDVSFGVLSVERIKNSDIFEFILAEKNTTELEETPYKTLVQSVLNNKKKAGRDVNE